MQWGRSALFGGSLSEKRRENCASVAENRRAAQLAGHNAAAAAAAEFVVSRMR